MYAQAAVMVLKNGEMVATVWAESIPYWSTASNVAVLSLERGDQVGLKLCLQFLIKNNEGMNE